MYTQPSSLQKKSAPAACKMQKKRPYQPASLLFRSVNHPYSRCKTPPHHKKPPKTASLFYTTAPPALSRTILSGLHNNSNCTVFTTIFPPYGVHRPISARSDWKNTKCRRSIPNGLLPAAAPEYPHRVLAGLFGAV